MARPYKTNSKQTPELEQKILTGITEGKSLHTICRDKDMPDRTTIHNWIKRDPIFAAKYDEAREERGNYYGEKVAELAMAVLAGKIDFNKARVAGDLFKWTAARMSPKNFGDRMELSHKAEDSFVDALKGVQAKVIEHEEIDKLPQQLRAHEGKKELKKAIH
tara:strand:+ start:175 stop:660 length:486 start_codon:yes stop_codon:yes gene_type:complete